MRSFWGLFLLTGAVFLGVFGLVEALEVPLLTNPEPWLSRGNAAAAAVGVGLLVSDVLLPVPSSLVMIAHGALFGWFWGALLSLAGSLGAAAFGFRLGRWSSPLLSRFISPEERGRAEAFLRRWGALAVLASRPVPILAETVSIAAGTSSLSWGGFLLATLLGSAPACLLYAVTGAAAAQLDSSLLVFGLVLLVAGVFWLAGRSLRSGLE